MAKNNTELNVTFKLINQEFNTKLREVNSSMKELRSEFALNESQFKLTGDKGTYLENKLKTLRSQEGLLKDKVKDAEKALQDTVAVYGENSKEAETMRTKLNYAKKEFADVGTKIKRAEADLKAFNNQADLIDLDKKISNIQSKMTGLKIGAVFQKAGGYIKGVGKDLQDVGNKMTEVGKKLTVLSAGVTAFGVASVKAFGEVDSGTDTIIAKTGATGDELESMETMMKNMATTIPTSFETAGEAIGEVNTRFGVTGDELESLSTEFVKFAKLNGTDVASSVDSAQKALSAYGLSAKECGPLLDTLTQTSQKTGVSVDTLSNGLVQNGTAFQKMGLNIDQSIALMGQMEKSGANSETVMNGLRKALKSATAEGKPMNQALTELEDSIVNNKNETEGLKNAYKLFGKSGDQIYGALKNGSLSFKDLAKSASDASGTVDKTYESMLDDSDKFTTSMNQLKSTMADVGESVAGALAPALDKVNGALKVAGDWFNKLSPAMKTAAVVFGIVLAAIGPVVAIIGTVVGAIGSVVSVIGTVVGAIGTAITFITNMGGVIATVSAGFQAFIAVIGSVVAAIGAIPIAIGAVIAAFILLYTKCEWFRNGVNAIINTVVNAFKSLPKTAENVKNSVTNAFNALKANVAKTWNSIKSAVSTAINAVKSTVSKAVTAIKSALSFNGLKATVTKVFNSIKSAITGPIDAAKTKIKTIISGIKNLFPLKVGKIFTGLKIPKIVVSGGKIPYGIGGLGTPPKIDIKWNKIAEDMPYLFKKGKATLFGAGDANDEIIYGRENLMNDITKAISRANNVGDTTQNITLNIYGAEGQSVNDLAREVEKRLINAQNRRRVAWD